MVTEPLPRNVQALMVGGNLFFVAERENRIVGAVFVRITGNTGYFGMLAVDPALQGSGIGHALREHAEALVENMDGGRDDAH